ncbi:MAG TPA: hypothetical protein VGO45_03940 [Bacteroidia bacterium]|jgi:hypothetical protein|nr:hypothetical protein [Bacteroidia bacterium]
MKKCILPLLFVFLISACSENKAPKEKEVSDSIAIRKHTLTEEIPPPSDIRQFKWFYSAFVKLVSLHADSLLNKVINPEFGLNIIESNGALPKITNVRDFANYKTLHKKAFYDFDGQVLICDPKDEELPKIDCNAKDLYTKTGCFTREVNTLKDSKVWEYCNLSKDKSDLVARSAQTITRTVLITNNYTYYFSLIKGSWWLTFVDMRRPCEA